jgi:hypothetical protein
MRETDDRTNEDGGTCEEFLGEEDMVWFYAGWERLAGDSCWSVEEGEF